MASAPATGPVSRSTRASRRAAERIMGSLRPGAYQSGGPFLAATGIEARHGFPGTRRALGGVGGHFGPPRLQKPRDDFAREQLHRAANLVLGQAAEVHPAEHL